MPESVAIKLAHTKLMVVFGCKPYLNVEHHGDLLTSVSGDDLVMLHKAIGLAIEQGDNE